MTVRLARDSLTIFVQGDEEPGLIAYGLTTPELWQGADFPTDVWIAEPEPETFALIGEDWRVHGWEVPIIIWPTGLDFEIAVRSMLAALVRGGCRVAWIGAEGVPFCDPPNLFDPDCMSGGVLAWMTDDGRFDCPLDPDRALTSVNDGVLSSLREHALGLLGGAGGSA